VLPPFRADGHLDESEMKGSRACVASLSESCERWRFAIRVFNSTIGKVRDGQLEGAVTAAGEAAKLVGRHGGDVRFFVAGAGEEVNSTLFSIE
jgi:hypothetical protein